MFETSHNTVPETLRTCARRVRTACACEEKASTGKNQAEAHCLDPPGTLARATEQAKRQRREARREARRAARCWARI